jgi:hypothetical protein
MMIVSPLADLLKKYKAQFQNIMSQVDQAVPSNQFQNKMRIGKATTPSTSPVAKVAIQSRVKPAGTISRIV